MAGVETLAKEGVEKTYLNTMKVIYDKLTAKITLNS